MRSPFAGFSGEADHPITDGVPAFADALLAAGKRFEDRL